MSNSRSRVALGLGAGGVVLVVLLLAWCSGPEDPGVLPDAPARRRAAAAVEPRAPVAPMPPAEPVAAPEPASDPPTPAPPPPPAPTRVLVRDMATGEAVPDLDLRCGDRVLTTDSGGIGLVPPGPVGSFAAIQGGPWRLANAVPLRGDSEAPILWVYRMMEVRGRLTSVSTLASLETDRVKLRGVTGLPPFAETGLTRGLLRLSRLDRVDLSDGLTPDGTFLVEVPCVPGYRLTASVRGWTPDSVALTTALSQFVSLRLTIPSIAIRGTLRDTTGAPLSGAMISVYVIVVMPLSELDRAAVLAAGHAYTLITNRIKNRAVLKYHLSTSTRPDGSFEVAVNAKGRLVVVAKPRGDFHTTLVVRASFEDDVDGLEMTAASGDGRRVRVVRSGDPFHGRIILSDVTGTEQHTVIPHLKKTNEFFMAKLIPGHQYRVRIHAELGYSAHLIWDERPVIDLATLSEEADLSKVSPERR